VHKAHGFRRSVLGLVVSSLCLAAFASEDPGHSRHGTAFDSGMRTKPWEMKGLGNTPFPITCKNAEVQKWFDQGNALLHSFWFEEAERSFRWCLKLDPDCAMAYWGLARCGFNWFSSLVPSLDEKDFGRYRKFLNEAIRRKADVSERERTYIEAWERGFAPEVKERREVLVDELQSIVLAYPDDSEAKALLALFNIRQGSALANQLVIDQVLAKNPMHPGAHHASIHNWDGVSPAQAIKSCQLYGQSAPDVGHARHMPGHIYSKIGMWHEAAIAMDSATRIELQYMNDRLALPFETWNFPHNRDYLGYIQEQLGMAEASIRGAKDLLASPIDPDDDAEDEYDTTRFGRSGLLRALIKFERWDEVLAADGWSWKEKDDDDKFMKAFVETVANVGLGRVVEARDRFAQLESSFDEAVKKDKNAEEFRGIPFHAAEGLLLVAEGEFLDGQRALLDAARLEQRARNAHDYPNDPPMLAWPVMRLVGDAYFKRGDYRSAVDAYEQALENEPNDAFSLSGLARTWYALKNAEQAELYAGRLAHVWSNADPGLKWMTEVTKLGLGKRPVADTLAPERVYRPQDLDRLGPSNWAPYAAPKLDVANGEGKPVRLEDYHGQNVVLVFFIGDYCIHCVEQLAAMNKRMTEFEEKKAVVLAVCSAPPSQTKASSSLKDVKIPILSDSNHENARRFASYDDFEEIELHSTILIDGAGRVRWKRTGGAPFMNIDFLLQELGRVNDEMREK